MEPPTRSRLEVLALGDDRVEVFLAREPEQRFSAHWHPQWSVGAIRQGRCRFACAGRTHEAGEGDVVVMPPATVHTAGVSVDGFEMTMLYLPPGWTASLMGWPGGEVPERVDTVLHDATLARGLADAVAKPGLRGLPELLRRALAAACSRETRPALDAPDDERVQRMCRELAACTGAPPDMGRLAEALAMSREHAHRLFKRIVGMTPGDYWRNTRIHDARRLLLSGAAIADVAAACGFCDQAHFSRWFKRVFGLTPATVQRAASELTARPAVRRSRPHDSRSLP